MKSIIPAQPGYSLVYIDAEPGETPYVDSTPVIAWLVETEDKHGSTSTTPVTINDTTDGQFLQAPDGRLFHYGAGEWFDTLEQAVAFSAKRERIQAEKRAAATKANTTK